MSWLRIDDNAPTHRKILRVSPAARWLWVCGLAYCQRHRTDGYIPAEALATCGVERPKPLARELVGAGLWHQDVNNASGWRVHDFLDWNESAQERDAKTAEKAERQRKWRAGRRDVDASRDTDVDASTREVRDAAPTPPPTPTPTPPPKRESARAGYGDPHGQRLDPSAAFHLVGAEGQLVSVPVAWAQRASREHGLSVDRLDAEFRPWAGAWIRQHGYQPPNGNKLAWLDARLADWQAATAAPAVDPWEAKTARWRQEMAERKAMLDAEKAQANG